MNENINQTDLIITQNDNNLPVVDDYSDKHIAEISNRIQAYKQFTRTVLSITDANDWVDQSGKPYLMEKGANKLRDVLGIRFTNTKASQETIKDLEGKAIHIQYVFTSDVTYRGNTNEGVEGISSTQDDFFCKSGGKFKNFEDIDHSDLRKKAHANLIVRGVYKALGLNPTWEDLKNAGIDKNKIASISRKNENTSENGKGVLTNIKKQIREMLLDLNDGDTQKASDELVKMTSFTNSEGKKIDGKKRVEDLTDRQAEKIFPDIKKTHEFNFGKQGE